MTKCTTCGIDKPDSEYYQNKTRDKLQQPCKDCRREYQREHHRKMQREYATKRCATCGKTFPKTTQHFAVNANGKFISPCHACKEKQRKQRQQRVESARLELTGLHLFERSTIDPNERIVQRHPKPRRRNENYNPLDTRTWLPDWMRKDKTA